jgi:kynurenine formamidase
LAVLAGAGGCTASDALPEGQDLFAPSEVIDLGALVTEDLPRRVWGNALMQQLGFTKQNSFEVIRWAFDDMSGSDAYYTLFNHGGPHVDAPNHYDFGGGIDSLPVEAFSGPAAVFDARSFGSGPSIPSELFRGNVNVGDIVLIVTGYRPPATDDVLPEFPTLTDEAAHYLATLPVRAYGTDGFSVGYVGETSTSGGHYRFLSKGIPVYEQLRNVERLLGRERMFFTGVPLNIEAGDGMIVRPVVFVY